MNTRRFATTHLAEPDPKPRHEHEQPPAKVPPKEIWIRRAEGRTRECVTVTLTGERLFYQAAGVFARWRGTAPEGGGYHKCDFRVTYADGETYEGRFDLTRDGSCDLASHMRHHCEGGAGRWYPPHTNEARWATYLRDVVGEERVAAYGKFLDGYQIGDES
jgi:hypothetical protein